MDQQELRETLFSMAEPSYRQFSAKLLPGSAPLIGVRLPKLRSLAKRIAKGDWQNYLDAAYDDYFEEVMLQGMVIGYIKTDIETQLNQIQRFVPKIADWSVCDSFCIGLKTALEYPQRVWDFLQPYFHSDREFFQRFALVMLTDFYRTEEYIDRALCLLEHFHHAGYYARMAAAWAISMCYVDFPEKTMACLRQGHLDEFTYQKALQKIIESNQVSQEDKRRIRDMKRKR